MNEMDKRRRFTIQGLTLMAALCLSLWINTSASAQDTRRCTDDIAKFCKDVKPGNGGIARCLREHENDLSPACKAHIAEMRNRAILKVCEGDVEKLCGDINPGGGRIVKCLKEHENELSSGCKERLSQVKRK